MYLFAPYVCKWWKRQEDIRSPGPGIIGSAELPDWVLQTKFRSSARAVSTLNF